MAITKVDRLRGIATSTHETAFPAAVGLTEAMNLYPIAAPGDWATPSPAMANAQPATLVTTVAIFDCAAPAATMGFARPSGADAAGALTHPALANWL